MEKTAKKMFYMYLNEILEDELYNILLDYCEWSGFEPEDVIKQAVMGELECVLEPIRGFGLPKAVELYERLQNIKK